MANQLSLFDLGAKVPKRIVKYNFHFSIWERKFQNERNFRFSIWEQQFQKKSWVWLMTTRFGLATTTEWRKSTRTHCEFIASNVLMNCLNAAYCTTVRVLLRHSVVVASPKPIVINHTQLFTIRFGTFVPKSKSGSYISLLVLELPFPNRKAEVIFHYSFLNFHSQIEKRKLICHNLFWNKSKNRALFVLELALQIEERTEIGFTIRYETWS